MHNVRVLEMQVHYGTKTVENPVSCLFFLNKFFRILSDFLHVIVNRLKMVPELGNPG